MKKLILSLMIAMQLLAWQPKANAMSGGGTLAMIAGACLTFGGIVSAGVYGHSALTPLGIIYALAGIAILDKNNEQEIQFHPLTNEAIEKAHLTNEEAESYNQNIDRLNALTAEMQSKIDATEESKRVDVSKSLWNEARENQELPQETFSALGKLFQAAQYAGEK